MVEFIPVLQSETIVHNSPETYMTQLQHFGSALPQNLRQLTSQEIQQLEAQGNTSYDFQN